MVISIWNFLNSNDFCCCCFVLSFDLWSLFELGFVNEFERWMVQFILLYLRSCERMQIKILIFRSTQLRKISLIKFESIFQRIEHFCGFINYPNCTKRTRTRIVTEYKLLFSEFYFFRIICKLIFYLFYLFLCVLQKSIVKSNDFSIK